MTRLFWALAGIKAYRPTGLIFLALLLLLALFCALVVKLLLWLNDLWDSVWVVLVGFALCLFLPSRATISQVGRIPSCSVRFNQLAVALAIMWVVGAAAVVLDVACVG